MRSSNREARNEEVGNNATASEECSSMRSRRLTLEELNLLLGWERDYNTEMMLEKGIHLCGMVLTRG